MAVAVVAAMVAVTVETVTAGAQATVAVVAVAATAADTEAQARMVVDKLKEDMLRGLTSDQIREVVNPKGT